MKNSRIPKDSAKRGFALSILLGREQANIKSSKFVANVVSYLERPPVMIPRGQRCYAEIVAMAYQMIAARGQQGGKNDFDRMIFRSGLILEGPDGVFRGPFRHIAAVQSPPTRMRRGAITTAGESLQYRIGPLKEVISGRVDNTHQAPTGLVFFR